MIKKVLVDISFLSPEMIGRKRTYHTEYRPAFEIEKGKFYSGNLLFHDQNFAHAGDEIAGEVQFLHYNLIAHHLSIGKEFNFFEGPKKLGSIKIKQIK